MKINKINSIYALAAIVMTMCLTFACGGGSSSADGGGDVLEDLKVTECESFEEFEIALAEAEPGDILKLNYSFTEGGSLAENFAKIRNALFAVKTNVILDLSDAQDITSIPTAAFRDSAKGNLVYLTGITLPKTGLISLEYAAFENCRNFESIVIPSSVKSIGMAAFYYCSKLSSVTIPEGVTSIGESAFFYCQSLESITIPSSIESIGLEAFRLCTGLTNFTITEGVKNIGPGDYIFTGCTSLANITIPSSVTSIGRRPFYYCSSLTTINVDAANTVFTSIDGNLYSKNEKTFVMYAPGKKNVAFTIPSGVETIAQDAFCNCQSLESIIIPSSVNDIGKAAFYYCNKLSSVTIPEGVKSIGDSVFASCLRLESITIPSTVTSIGISIFKDSIGLRTVNVNASNTAYTSIDNVVYSKDGKTLLACVPYKIGAIAIPEGVETIVDDAFYYCRFLNSITLPSTLKSIGNDTFAYCSGISSITIPAGVTSIGWTAFGSCSILTNVILLGSTPPTLGGSTFRTYSISFTVPEGARDNYINAAYDQGWYYYKALIL